MSAKWLMLAAAAICVASLAMAIGSFADEGKAAAKPEFAKVDKNNDGKVTEAEFEAYVVAYPELGITKTVFTEIDLNKDGTITASEWVVWEPMPMAKGAGCPVAAPKSVPEKAETAPVTK